MDVSKATATPDKVIMGETFFAGSAKMQTGTLTSDSFIKFASGQTVQASKDSGWRNFPVTGVGFQPTHVSYYTENGTVGFITYDKHSGSTVSKASNYQAPANDNYGSSIQEDGFICRAYNPTAGGPTIIWYAYGY